MSIRDLVAGNCEGGPNPLGGLLQGIEKQERPVFRDPYMPQDWAESGSDVPTQEQIESYMQRFSDEGPPIFANDDQLNEYLASTGAYGADDIDWSSMWGSNAYPFISPGFSDYTFQVENPFLQAPNSFEQGMDFFQRGLLQDAILCFEAVVQKDPQSSDAWRWLGSAHAENDEDKRAISALHRALEADPGNIEALLDAGVSYTNELVQVKALQHLQDWLRAHEEYRSILDNNPPVTGNVFDQQRQVIDLFIQAVKVNPVDADLHAVLGVLWNLTREYDKAEEAFKTAVSIEPNNYSFWNKLGATQANSPRLDGSADAVHAYRQALERKPNYVRAWVNMGISYANQRKYNLAAKYYLKALSLNSNPDHIWSYLRLALSCMDRPDLAALTEERNVNLFRDTFSF